MEYENGYTVYVKTDSDGYITAVNSSAFLADASGWTEIGRGSGDKYHHAQNHFFPEPVRTERGAYRYKLMDSRVVLCTGEEIAAREKENEPEERSLEERIRALETGASEMKRVLAAYLGKAAQE